MRKAVRLKPLTPEEEAEIRRLAASRKETHRLIQREKVIVASLDDPKLHAIQAGAQAGFSGRQSGVSQVKCFNEEGLAGLEDKMKLPVTLFLLLTISLVMSACMPGQALGPTLTPAFNLTSTTTPTLTHTPFRSITPTLTYTPTFTFTPSPTFFPTLIPRPTPIAISVENAKSLVSLKVLGDKFERGHNTCRTQISPDLKYNLHVLLPNTFALWDTLTGQEISDWGSNYKIGLIFPDFGYVINPPCDTVAFSPDSKHLAVGGKTGIYLYSTDTGILDKSIDLRKKNNSVTVADYLTFSPDSKYLVFVGYESAEIGKAFYDPEVFLWNLDTWESTISIPWKGIGWADAFSPDGKTLAIDSNLGNYHSILFLDVPTLKVVRTFATKLIGNMSLLFSKDGKELIGVNQFCIVNIWDVASGELISTFTPYKNDPTGQGRTSITRNVIGFSANSPEAATISPDGAILAVGYLDGSIILWDLETTQPLFVYLYPHPSNEDVHLQNDHIIYSLVFSSDGSMLVVSSGDNTITFWGVP